MKKNWTMRVALLMVALTLITSCFVSGTYAKYVTAGGANDTARVAKFGVIIESDGNLFADTYKTTANTPGETTDTTAYTSLSVVSSAAAAGPGTDVDNVVAPGTKNDDGVTISVTGTPEVAVNVALTVTAADGSAFDATTDEIYLKAVSGNAAYKDMTTAAADDVFAPAADYYPVKFTLSVAGTTVVNAGTLSDVVTALGNLSTNYPANTNLGTVIGDIVLTWEWDFDDSGAGTYDKEDTLLGDLAADATLTAKTADKTADPIVWAALTAGTDYNLTTGIAITITVTQID